jgi:glutathione synthase/RimK-type ligase-like ATP-grasp enzyme
MRTLYVYKDGKGWSAQIIRALTKKKDVKVVLFADVRTVPSGSDYFVRMDQQGDKRDVCKRVVEELYKKGCRGIPTLKEAHWYDNKLAQYAVLSQWLPETRIITSVDDQVAELSFPFISKSSEGASSANVRVIHNEREAKAEAKSVFVNNDMTLKYGRKQEDYLYWQDMIPNDGTYRVTVTLGYVWGYYRKNDPKTGLVMFPAQGHQLSAASEDDKEVMGLGWEMARSIDTDWIAFDVIKDSRNGKLYCLELSSAWPHKKDIEMGCKMWVKSDGEWVDSGKKAKDLMGEIL